ncbi:hypothetical protein OKW21_006697 [Catalinimonas alkaloidigena]|uniref:hypothetical protein n=1 Tax=Catalinimonas alkaloidigena TaxID=1075417 RepID=UPI00240639F3|nr:hypothetical protein [Catalinimonas alkaloidigena]MDF9801388.1 hypothetical protein [Catalinimonas alkaloidigena]
MMTEKFFSKAFISKTLYGSITILAVLLSFKDHQLSAWHGMLLLFGTSLSVAHAEAFSETISQVIAGKKKLDKKSFLSFGMRPDRFCLQPTCPY